MTGREIYEKSLALIGERGDGNAEGFADRAPKLINLFLAELRELDCTLRGEKCAPQGSAMRIDSLDQEIGYADAITASLIPLGLAAFLLHEEEPARAGFFYQLYSRQADQLRLRCRKGRRHKIRGLF